MQLLSASFWVYLQAFTPNYLTTSNHGYSSAVQNESQLIDFSENMSLFCGSTIMAKHWHSFSPPGFHRSNSSDDFWAVCDQLLLEAKVFRRRLTTELTRLWKRLEAPNRHVQICLTSHQLGLGTTCGQRIFTKTHAIKANMRAGIFFLFLFLSS